MIVEDRHIVPCNPLTRYCRNLIQHQANEYCPRIFPEAAEALSNSATLHTEGEYHIGVSSNERPYDKFPDNVTICTLHVRLHRPVPMRDGRAAWEELGSSNMLEPTDGYEISNMSIE